LQPEQLVVPAAVVDVSVRASVDPDYVLDRRGIESWEQKWGRILPGALVLLHTGWHRYWEEPHRFINADSSGVMHTPGFAPEAARELLQARGASGLGTDAPGVDAGVDTGFEVSRLVLEKHRLVLECLNNLDQLPPAGSTIVVGRLSLVGGSGSPASVLALTP
jgi:kynurenine formamidase